MRESDIPIHLIILNVPEEKKTPVIKTTRNSPEIFGESFEKIHQFLTRVHENAKFGTNNWEVLGKVSFVSSFYLAISQGQYDIF